MKISRNIMAVMTNKELRRTENKLKASMGRLSSGFKINSAGQNPAGMAITNKMKAQIDALKQAETNAGDGISILQVADGALNEVSSMMQRIRELSVQAANDSNSYAEKLAIQKEIDQIVQEVDRISNDTEFNTKKILDGSSDTRVYADGISRVFISDEVPAGKYNLTITDVGEQATSSINIPATVPASGKIMINGISVDLEPGMTQNEYIQELQKAAMQAGAEFEITGGEMKLTSTLYGQTAAVNISISPGLISLVPDPGSYNAVNGMLVKESYGKNAVVELTTVGASEIGFSSNATWTSSGNRVYIQDNNGFSMDFLIDKDTEDATDVEIEVADLGRMTLQIGANEFQTMDVRIPSTSAEFMYLDTVDVTVVGGAGRAIETLDKAISYLSEVRSRIGAFQNRLEYASGSLAETQEDMTTAYSRILDTDMAEEMTTYAQLNVLNQATISILSQANDLPQQVLSLLS